MKTKLGLNKAQKSTHQSLTKPFGKKFMSLVLCICMLIGVPATMPINVFAETSGKCGDNATWTLDDEGTLTINGTGIIKNSYGWYDDEVKSIVINSGITEISNGMFSWLENLESVYLPNTLKSIGDSAFRDCIGLTSINIPNSVTSIGWRAFEYCTSLKTINIPDGIETIANRTFANCTSLKTVNIPSGLKTIEFDAFADCTSLSTVSVPDSVTYIDTNAFSGCANIKEFIVDSSNENYSALNGNLYSKDGTKLLRYASGKSDTSFNVSKSIHSIDEGAFECSNNLSCISVDVDNPCYTSVDGNLYYKETGAESIILVRYAMGKSDQSFTIPKWVQEIGLTAFSGSGNLTNIVIPEGIQKMGYDINNNGNWIDYCITDCESLLSVHIPDSVSIIGEGAFWGCSRLNDVNIPNSVTEIGYSAFSYCSGLTSVTIPNRVTSIGDRAFSYCSGLTSVTIPDSITDIGSRAFYKCNNLSEVHISDIAAWCNIDFSDALYYAHNLYLNDSLITDLIIPDGVTNINAYVFSYCTGLTSVTIPNSVTSINGDAFYGCNNLSDVWYDGTEEEKKKINIREYNDDLLNATWHYNGTIPVNIPNYKKGGDVIAAIYNSDDMLISINTYIPAEFINVSYGKGGAYMKVMQWETGTMKPLAPEQRIDL